MRKLLASLLAISFFIIIFCGCDTRKKVSIQTEFERVCECDINEMSLTLKVTSANGENVALELLSDGDMKGLKYERVNSNLYVEYEGLRCIACEDYLEVYNPFDILIDSLIAIKSTPLEFTHSEGECDVYKGRSEGGEFFVYVNSESGEIEKLKPDYEEYEFEFSK